MSERVDLRVPEGVHREPVSSAGEDAVGATLPVGFRTVSSDEGFSLVVTARPRYAGFLTLFAVLWDGILAAIVVAMGWERGLEELFPLSAHVLAGLVVTYLALRARFNRIETRVVGGTITVRHRPFPWFAPGPIPSRAVQQLFVVEDYSLKLNNRPVLRYALRLKTRDGRDRRLFIVDALSQARYIEQQIERALRIPDHAVAGEAPGKQRR